MMNTKTPVRMDTLDPTMILMDLTTQMHKMGLKTSIDLQVEADNAFCLSINYSRANERSGKSIVIKNSGMTDNDGNGSATIEDDEFNRYKYVEDFNERLNNFLSKVGN